MWTEYSALIEDHLREVIWLSFSAENAFSVCQIDEKCLVDYCVIQPKTSTIGPKATPMANHIQIDFEQKRTSDTPKQSLIQIYTKIYDRFVC